MLYADKIMNTERYKELKDVGNKIAKKYLSTKYEASVAKGIPMKYLSFFKEFSKKLKSNCIKKIFISPSRNTRRKVLKATSTEEL